MLFKSIDRDHDGRLDKSELRAAFKKAGLAIPNSKLDQFFGEVDDNHDVCYTLRLSLYSVLIYIFIGLYYVRRMAVRQSRLYLPYLLCAVGHFTGVFRSPTRHKTFVYRNKS